MEETVAIIEELIADLRKEDVNPDVLAKSRLNLATYLGIVGKEKVRAKLAYKVELGQIMRDQKLPANQATIIAETHQNYADFTTYDQLYNDMRAVISSARTMLDVLSDERYG